jgi:DNA polymerase III delta subunit
MAKEADPRAEWNELRDELARGRTLRPAYLLRGAERWYRDRALDLVLARAREAQLEVCRHDARDGEFRLEALLDDLGGTAMFASARCVVVLEPEALLKRTAGGEESSFVRGARGFVRGRRGTLVLAADSLRSDLAVVRELLEAGATLRSFRKLYERPGPWQRDQDPRRGELVQWLLARASERQIALDAEAALLLVHACGNDLAALEGQLAGIAAGGRVALASLEARGAGSPWEVADALVAGDLPRALLAIETLYRGGARKERDGTRETNEAALQAMTLGGVRNKVRAGVAYAFAVERGRTQAEALEEAGIGGNERVLRAAVEWRGPRQWRAMLEDLLELERRSRRGAEVDASELARLALRWRRPSARPGVAARR